MSAKVTRATSPRFFIRVQNDALWPRGRAPFRRPHPHDRGTAALAIAAPHAVDPPCARDRAAVPAEPADDVRNQCPASPTNRAEQVTICVKHAALPNSTNAGLIQPQSEP